MSRPTALRHGRPPATGIATEHAGEAADTLRHAAGITDPYLRADAIWEAAVRVQSAAARLAGRAAERCSSIARGLEDSCEADGAALTADALTVLADELDSI